MTTFAKKPAYEDKVPVANKITLAAHTTRETTILLQDHVGTQGRKKDGEIIAYMMAMGDGNLDDLTILDKFANDPEFLHIAQIVLDLEDEDGAEVMEKMTLFDLAAAFKEGMDFRTSQVRRDDVQEALKKSKGGEDTEETV